VRLASLTPIVCATLGGLVDFFLPRSRQLCVPHWVVLLTFFLPRSRQLCVPHWVVLLTFRHRRCNAVFRDSKGEVPFSTIPEEDAQRQACEAQLGDLMPCVPVLTLRSGAIPRGPPGPIPAETAITAAGCANAVLDEMRYAMLMFGSIDCALDEIPELLLQRSGFLFGTRSTNSILLLAPPNIVLQCLGCPDRDDGDGGADLRLRQHPWMIEHHRELLNQLLFEDMRDMEAEGFASFRATALVVIILGVSSRCTLLIFGG
jgi:hypothetical protein